MEDRTIIRELFESNKLFHLFMEESIQPIWWFEIDEPYSVELPEDEQIELLFNRAYVKFVNSAYLEVAGIERREDVYGLYVRDIIPPSIPENVESLRQIVQASYNLRDFETIEYYQGKQIVTMNTINGFVEDGKITHVWGTSRDITALKDAERKLRQQLEQIKKLQKVVEADRDYLQEEIKLEHNFENIIGQSQALEYVLHRVELVAPKDSTVILLGETGTGKELFARALHQLSSRNKRPVVKVNCAALPSELIESELFGREKGAYTGATTQIGRFELANKTTLFLDEIGELPFDLQAKLLRVLESGEFERLGSPKTLHSDARLIVATNRNLEEEVRNGRFREDLWYRLKIFPITIPPLRDRAEDVPLLVSHFVDFYAKKMGIDAASLKITESSMRALQSYGWPGNVRELKNVVESALITSSDNRLHFDLPIISNVSTGKLKTFEEMERDYLLEVLDAKNWKIKGRDSASEILGLPPSTLRSRIKRLGLEKP